MYEGDLVDDPELDAEAADCFEVFLEPSDARLKCPEQWEGFLRSSSPADMQRRHNAKCKKCGKVFLGIKPYFSSHKKKCINGGKLPDSQAEDSK